MNQSQEYTFIIQGHIKPYVRMTQAGKWVKDGAQDYLTSKYSIGLQLTSQMAANDWTVLPAKTPLIINLDISVEKRKNCSDLDNIVKAILDSANGIVYPDDRWIDEITARRFAGEKDVMIVKVRPK